VIYVMGVDPGFPTSGVTVLRWSEDIKIRKVIWCDPAIPNKRLIEEVFTQCVYDDMGFNVIPELSAVAMEKLVPYGKNVGAATFETIWDSAEMYRSIVLSMGEKRVATYSRPTVKIALVGATTVKVEGSIKGVSTAILKEIIRTDFHPSGGGNDPWKGTKSKRGPLYLVKKEHGWDALAVAMAHLKS
jgi:Holliday junction resolvasome RuvABC endonuclease subunit